MSRVTLFRLFLKHAVPTMLIAATCGPKSGGSQQGATRILVVRLDGIGDFILLTPFLRELRRNYPDANITLVVGKQVSQLAMSCPYVNETLILEPCPQEPIFSRPRNVIPFVRYLKYLTNFAESRLGGHIDIAIQPKWDADLDWATLLTFLSGADMRFGYSERTSHIKALCNLGHSLLFTHVIPPGIEQHEVDRNLGIIRSMGGTVNSATLEVWSSPEDKRKANAFFAERHLSGNEHLIAFGIGATQRRRQWPFYGDLIRSLASKFDFIPLLLAGVSDEELARSIKDVSPPAILVERTPLGAVASILSRCALFVGNDSGPMHLASAVGLPVVEISCHPVGGDPQNANSPDRFGPLARLKAIIRPRAVSENCLKGCVEDTPHCIAEICVEEVALAVMKLREQRRNVTQIDGKHQGITYV